MKSLCLVPLALALMAISPQAAHASTAYGDLNNFDTVNDTGHECHGFEIEIEGVHSTDITYTYDWNHYGAPRITDDNSDTAHPKVFIRYQSARNPDGTWAAYTAIPSGTLTPTDGHSCTNPAVNDGCEHYGVGYYGAPTAVRYHWLYDDGTGNLVYSEPVLVATPNWTYAPPDPGVAPAVVVAAIPAPDLPIPPGFQFGEPSWVKVIKTTTHKVNDIALEDLISDDADGIAGPDWQNGEPAEVESEFRLLQTNDGANPDKEEVIGMGDDMGDDGAETVTRRYEFYRYAAAADTIDGENGEAMCDEVNPTTDPDDPLYLHGIGTAVEVADLGGGSHFVNCESQIIVGDYIGAQMAGFDAAMPLGLVDNLQGGDKLVAYTPRTVVVGGNSPYVIDLTSGSLPPGLTLGDFTDPDTLDTLHGVLYGTPTTAGDFAFTVEATDVDNVVVSKSYTMKVTGDVVVPQYALVVEKFGSGSGNVAGNGIDCGATCDVMLDEGTAATLTATPDTGSVFDGWGGDCAGTGDCIVTLNADSGVSATFTQQYLLTVNKPGSGSGTVAGNGIDCGTTCSTALDSGTAVSLTAAPAAGSIFTGWSGDCSGTGACDTTMTAARNVTATFDLASQQYTLTVAVTGSGTVTSKPKGINCGKQCSHAYTVGTSITLTAKPARKHAFLGWSGGGCSGTALTCVLPMSGNKNVTATFN